MLKKMWCPYCKGKGDVICWIIILPSLALGFYGAWRFAPIILGLR